MCFEALQLPQDMQAYNTHTFSDHYLFSHNIEKSIKSPYIQIEKYKQSTIFFRQMTHNIKKLEYHKFQPFISQQISVDPEYDLYTVLTERDWV